MKILLVDLAPHKKVEEPYENLGLGYLTSILREKDYNVQQLSCIVHNLTLQKLINRIISVNPDLLGLSVKSLHAKQMKKLVEELREKGFKNHITLGGHFPTFHYKEILRDIPQIDTVIRGEGELTLLELVENLKDKNFNNISGLSYRVDQEIKNNEPRELICNIDKIPFPARDHTSLILKRSRFISISASRGCYANCSFCSIANFYKKSPGKNWRCRSPKNIVAEMKLLAEKYGNTNFKFIDDQLFLNNRHALEFTKKFQEELIRNNLEINFVMNCRANHIDYDIFMRLKKNGLKKVFIGIESAHQRGLETFNKGTSIDINNNALKTLEELNIEYDIGFILIDPYTNYQELFENLKFLTDLKQKMTGNNSYLSVTTSLTIFGGTPIFHKLSEESRLSGNYIEGYKYTVDNINVQLFRFIMETIIAKKILPIYHKYLLINQIIKRNNYLTLTKLRSGFKWPK